MRRYYWYLDGTWYGVNPDGTELEEYTSIDHERTDWSLELAIPGNVPVPVWNIVVGQCTHLTRIETVAMVDIYEMRAPST